MVRRDVVQLLKEEIARGVAPGFCSGTACPIAVRSAPGRLDVLGGLGAESGGTVAQMALPARVGVAVQLRDEPQLVIRSEQIVPPVGRGEVTLELDSFYTQGTLIPATEVPALVAGARSWITPITALWHILLSAWPKGPMGGTVLIRGEVPMGAGQASSTALLTAMLLAVCESRRITMEAEEQAQWIQRAEMLSNQGLEMRGGTGHILDALTSLLAAPSAMLRYSTQPYRLAGPVPVPVDVRVLAMDTGVRYTSAREALEELRIAGTMGRRIIETIYTDLGQRHTPLHGYLANTSPLLYRQYFRMLLPKRMRAQDFVRAYGPLPEGSELVEAGRLYRVRTAVDHLIAEHEHAEQFLQAMEELADLPAGEGANPERQKILQRAGRLALASHHSYRLRLELSCREADWLVDRLMEAGPERGIFGARITGCGGGGTVMALVDRSSVAGDAVLEVMKAYHQVTGLALGIAEAGAGGSLWGR
ncbi:MAG TPA: hypothetical protein VM008_20845 [Phycisphaerae bacterium]|nr:hypothetical protein [Phycisphaerae bacterium]